MKTILIGYGNVGKALHTLLREKGIEAKYFIQRDGIYSIQGQKIDETTAFMKYIDSETVAYIATPSTNNTHENLSYYLEILKAGAKIVTCEKSVLAHHWDEIKPFMRQLRYSATVGGNSGILPAIANFDGKIHEIKAIINGTLNIISQESASKSPEELFTYVTSEGFAEPGAKNFDEVIENELHDVLYKAVILANHSGLYDHTINLSDIEPHPFQAGLRCMCIANSEGIHAGFIHDDDTSWFSKGVNNVLCINGQKIVEGPGAGPRATAERMYADFLSF